MDPNLLPAHSHGGPTAASPAVKWSLGIAMALLFVATVAGVVGLWPHEAASRQPWLHESASLASGSITAIVPEGEGGHMVVLLDSGTTVDVPVEPSAPLSEARVGQRVQVMVLQDPPGAIFFDYARGAPLLFLAALFVVVVVAA